MEKLKLEISLQELNDFEYGWLKYHKSKLNDANNNVTLELHLMQMEKYKKNIEKIELWLITLTEANKDVIEKAFNELKANS